MTNTVPLNKNTKYSEAQTHFFLLYFTLDDVCIHRRKNGRFPPWWTKKRYIVLLWRIRLKQEIQADGEMGYNDLVTLVIQHYSLSSDPRLDKEEQKSNSRVFPLPAQTMCSNVFETAALSVPVSHQQRRQRQLGRIKAQKWCYYSCKWASTLQNVSHVMKFYCVMK